MKTITLNNGIEMPQMGYGVYQVTPEECERCVSDALSAGYRMIDTAQAYHNEEGVGRAVKKSGIGRNDIFIVSKVWISNYGYDKAKASIDESLRKLQTDHIDLMLLHQPFCDRYGAYRALEDAYKEGKVRAIGVSNFYPDHFIDLASNVNIVPAVNQVETHVFDQQKEAQKIMKEFGTQICHGDRWQKAVTTYSATNFLPELAPDTARQWLRWPCAGSCSEMLSSYPRPHTLNA